MSIIDSLVTDRTQDDYHMWKGLLAKWQDGTITEAEKARWLLPMKGAYNAADLNRVGAALNYVRDRLRSAGYAVSWTAKTDWTQQAEPTRSQMEKYLGCVADIRAKLAVTPDTPQPPGDMSGLTYQQANDIEKILVTVDDLITKMAQAWFLSGEIYSGEV